MAETLSIIGADVTVRGTLVSSADVTIDGKVDGDIRASGNVTVSESGRIFGNLYAEQATIRGRVEGSVRARKVQLSATCHVVGDIFHARLAIEEGAFFEGNCRHAEDPVADAPQGKDESSPSAP